MFLVRSLLIIAALTVAGLVLGAAAGLVLFALPCADPNTTCENVSGSVLAAALVGGGLGLLQGALAAFALRRRPVDRRQALKLLGLLIALLVLVPGAAAVGYGLAFFALFFACGDAPNCVIPQSYYVAAAVAFLVPVVIAVLVWLGLWRAAFSPASLPGRALRALNRPLTLVVILAAVVACGGLFAANAVYRTMRATLPGVAWTFDTASDSLLMQAEGSRAYVSDQRILHALDDGGRRLWTSPTLDGDRIARILPGAESVFVLMPLAAFGGDHKLHALDAASGAPRWTADAVVENTTIGVQPFVTDRHIYVGDRANSLLALDRATGQPAWRAALGGRVLLEPRTDGGLVYFIREDGALVAANDADGRVAWTARLDPLPESVLRDGARNYVYGSLVKDGTLFVWDPWRVKLWAFDAAAGRLRWTANAAPDADSAALYHDGVLYFTHGRDSMPLILVALDGATGRARFDRNLGQADYPPSPLMVVGDTLVLAGRDTTIYGVNRQTGDILWQRGDESNCCKRTVVHGNIGYFASGPQLQAIDLPSGRVLWSRRSRNGEWISIAATDKTLLVSAEPGHVAGIPLEK